ncbi:hypothetical protein L7F22_012403 [Adiantum nelumboides]|nr:hypothetical protein [Adiantum nelumboides]
MEVPVPSPPDLNTPPPSPPSKKPKLEPPTTPVPLHSSHNPFNQNQVDTQQKESQEAHQIIKQNNQDLPDDFLEPLDTNMNQVNSTFSFPSSGTPPSCSSDKQSSNTPAQSSGTIISLPQQVSNLMPSPPSSSACATDSTLVTPVASLPTRHLRGVLPPLPSSFPPSQSTINPISASHPPEVPANNILTGSNHGRGCRQFWKAGDYEGYRSTAPAKCTPGGIDHVRVHPKFLHSNATSHKWALGGKLLYHNRQLFFVSIEIKQWQLCMVNVSRIMPEQVSNGATFVNVDMECNPHDGGPMLLFEDNGGGMNPDCLRQCMSLGYSVKSKQANTIGQYGNGFKTSTMRLGSDVLVFTRHPAKSGGRPTQSIGMLSYSFLRDTFQDDIIVPMVDYEVESVGLRKLIRSTEEDWTCNMGTITKWSPYHTELALLNQFQSMKHQGTKIVIYNLWEDDEGHLELDFEANFYDIQVRGANRDESKIAMAEKYPNSRHYLTYRHSLRSYASILYLRLPDGFHINLRGKEVEHHPLVNDMMLTQEHTYKPHSGGNADLKETNMMVVVTIGFVKDAKEHIDVQGFNVYHKNRLIKVLAFPLIFQWGVFTLTETCSYDSLFGVSGMQQAVKEGELLVMLQKLIETTVLEANFVEPAHDKQGFERTVVLGRLETRLLQMQKLYWKQFSHRVGYAKKDSPRVHYPARGLIRLEAPPVNQMLTRGTASMRESFYASQMHVPEAVSMFHATPEECISSGFPISVKEGIAADYTTHVEAECVGFHDSTRAFPLRDEFASSLSNRNDTDAGKLKLEVKQNEYLKLKVLELQKSVDVLRVSNTGLRASNSELTKQRDKFKSLVEDQARRQAMEEQHLRNQLKAILPLEFLIPTLRVAQKLEWTGHELSEQIDVLEKLDETRLKAVASIYAQKRNMKSFFDQHVINKEFATGDYVLMYTLKQHSRKMQKQRNGPYVIQDISPSGAINLATLEGEEMPNWISGCRLKKYHLPLITDMLAKIHSAKERKSKLKEIKAEAQEEARIRILKRKQKLQQQRQPPIEESTPVSLATIQSCDQWQIGIDVRINFRLPNGQYQRALVDTGARINVVNYSTYKKMTDQPLMHCDKNIFKKP